MTRGDYQQRPDIGLFSSTSEVPKQRRRVLGKRATSPNRSFLPSGGGSRNVLLGAGGSGYPPQATPHLPMMLLIWESFSTCCCRSLFSLCSRRA